MKTTFLKSIQTCRFILNRNNKRSKKETIRNLVSTVEIRIIPDFLDVLKLILVRLY